MKKIFYYLLALILVAIISLAIWFDTIAKNAVESYAQKSVGSSVTVGEFRSEI